MSFLASGFLPFEQKAAKSEWGGKKTPEISEGRQQTDGERVGEAWLGD